MNSSMLRVIGIVFLVAGFFIDDIVDNFTVINEVEVVELGLSQPSDEISSIVDPIDDIITDSNDRLSMAIFNKICADRIPNWPQLNQQDFNDVYVSAAKKFFGDSMKGKYEDLDRFLIKVIMDVTGDDIHSLTPEERSKIIERLEGISWHLVK